MSDVSSVSDRLHEQHEQPADIHLPPPSIAPLIVGVGVVLAGLGLLVPPMLIVGAVVMLVGVWKMAHFPQLDLHEVHLTFLENRKLGMWAFLASEVMFFASLIGTFIAFKINHDNFAEVNELLNLPLATLGTSVLIVSSFAVVMALESIQSDDFRVFRNWMLITLVLGLSFIGVQALEWTELLHHDITAETVFGTVFYLTTGFHGLHVLGGIGWMLLLLVKAARGEYSASNSLGVELFGLYWHFVDIVWIVLFTVIYLVH